MKKNTKMLMGFSAIFIGIVILLIAATPGSSGTELTLEEFIKEPLKYEDRYVMTQGNLIEDTIKWDADKIDLRFDIKDEKGNVLHVQHTGVKPDNFTEGVIVIIEGFVNKDGSFTAEKVQTKCPSKYEGEDAGNYDPETHQKLTETK
ncbi:cytochrome c-type biogenesis protein CcmE [Schinkia azotoformans MEV2011]|uniref:Cytochrome c-type biogenesis protein CcmE n=1 Tax=Schinkia azotoformans MEV2011 TaxID=1348973 RepID=A0A072NQ39_SCHAZ|nr:cytochrome c maturation protein CcmE [Schinkia azotoformans]KEF39367.1 cytochrome c-type biogenesis protein CcmE [Schinkia azotoformans MEV2011]MEC1694881.1 cytochrome c maturation protein CcmE [Schinkia azotoformans]MEC1715675.1 cytochrome c maturation protein CcmE [Schinkia azotoformans]MEC1726715.1 cytochrome c maturation protein CcmE [Schinkia azotoformans]MEC1742217.1 cytochrome c maturation protein CcmE [Schinkia azotoformans]